MCGVVAGSMAVLGAVSGMMDAKNQNKAWAAQETARRLQALEMVRQANYADAALQLSAGDALRSARTELEDNSMAAIKAQGAVNTAMAESNLEGRTMERVKRDTENVYLRTRGAITENYERDYHNIWVQRETNRNQLIGALQGNPAQPRPSTGSQIMGVINSGVQGAIVGQNLWGTMQSDPNIKDSKTKHVTNTKQVK